MKATKTAVVLVLLLVTATAFALSFEALRDAAIQAHVSPSMAFGVPVSIDGLEIIAGVSVVLLGSHRSTAVRRYPWAVASLAAATSIAVNAAHGSGLHLSRVGDALLSSAPPICVLLGLHLLLLLVWSGPLPKVRARRTGEPVAKTVPSAGPAKPAAKPVRAGEVSVARSEAVAWVREQLASGAELTSRQVAEKFSVSQKSGVRYLAAARQSD